MRHVPKTLTVILVLTAAGALAQRGLPPEVRPLPVGGVVAPWEHLVAGAYENLGVAQIERLGTQWVLNVMCDGTHATSIEDTGIDLPKYASGYVHVRYRYVERTRADVACIKAPCPPVIERRIALEEVTPVRATAEAARQSARSCESPAAR